MAQRYGFVPADRVIVELYADKDLYSTRTVGVPGLGASGVCFGSVITALSPSAMERNWGMTLQHELGHVFALQLSKSRVPRWFTEGLSEYEALSARREWARHLDGEIRRALAAKELPTIAKLDRGFLRAQSIEEVVRAYHHASLMIQFLVETYGFPAIVDALEAYGAGRDTAAVLKAMTGLSLARLDKKFRKYLATRLAPYADADQYDAALQRGAAAIDRGDLAEAKAQLGRAKTLQPERSEPYALLYGAYTAAGDADAAAAELEAYVYLEPHDGASMKKLVALHAAKKSWDKVIELGEMARYVDPFDATLDQQLASAYQSK
jgi:tetratricopeptide (TPR) repeat protein